MKANVVILTCFISALFALVGAHAATNKSVRVPLPSDCVEISTPLSITSISIARVLERMPKSVFSVPQSSRRSFLIAKDGAITNTEATVSLEEEPPSADTQVISQAKYKIRTVEMPIKAFSELSAVHGEKRWAEIDRPKRSSRLAYVPAKYEMKIENLLRLYSPPDYQLVVLENKPGPFDTNYLSPFPVDYRPTVQIIQIRKKSSINDFEYTPMPERAIPPLSPEDLANLLNDAQIYWKTKNGKAGKVISPIELHEAHGLQAEHNGGILPAYRLQFYLEDPTGNNPRNLDAQRPGVIWIYSNLQNTIFKSRDLKKLDPTKLPIGAYIMDPKTGIYSLTGAAPTLKLKFRTPKS